MDVGVVVFPLTVVPFATCVSSFGDGCFSNDTVPFSFAVLPLVGETVVVFLAAATAPTTDDGSAILSSFPFDFFV